MGGLSIYQSTKEDTTMDHSIMKNIHCVAVLSITGFTLFKGTISVTLTNQLFADK